MYGGDLCHVLQKKLPVTLLFTPINIFEMRLKEKMNLKSNLRVTEKLKRIQVSKVFFHFIFNTLAVYIFSVFSYPGSLLCHRYLLWACKRPNSSRTCLFYNLAKVPHLNTTVRTVRLIFFLMASIHF